MPNTLSQSYLNKAKVDKFKLVFQVPAALRKISKHQLRSNNTIIEDSVQFSIYGSVVPEVIVPGVDIRYTGSTLYVSSHSRASYPPVTVNFTIDNLFNNYWVIYQWLNLLHNQKTGTFDAANLIGKDIFADYQTPISIYGLDEYENQRIKFTYTKAFPISLGAINYNYREAANIESSFTFVYSQLHTELLNT